MPNRSFPLLPSIKFTPLISFDTIIDLDTGLIELIRQEYADPNVFDVELLNLPDVILYSNLYYRPYRNPLYTIRNRNMKLTKNNIQLLDEYYDEFMMEKYDDILQLSKRTDMDELVLTFDKAKDITVYIMVYNERESMQIKAIDELSKIPIVYFSDINDDNSYNQIYLKYISDYKKFPNNIQNTSFYFSDNGVNLDDDNNPRDNQIDIVRDLIYSNNEFAVYNMYKENIINKMYLNHFTNIINYDMITEDNI